MTSTTVPCPYPISLPDTSPIRNSLLMNSLPGRPQPVKFFLLTTIILFVVIMAGISIAYALTPINRFTVGRNFLGLLGWTTLTASTIYISLKHRKECFFIFLLFFAWLIIADLKSCSITKKKEMSFLNYIKKYY